MTKSEFTAKFGKTIPDEFCYIFQPNLKDEKHGLIIIGLGPDQLYHVPTFVDDKTLGYDANLFSRCIIDPMVIALRAKLESLTPHSSL